MKAAILTALNAPLTIGEIELLPCDYGQVRVRVLVSGICGAQLQEIAGEKGPPPPHLLGHEGCGIVEEIGVGVKTVKVGDKVVMHWRKGEGIEADFARVIWSRSEGVIFVGGKRIGHPSVEMTCGLVTTFSEQAVVSENRVTAVPHDTPPELCALFGCGLSTALGTIESEAGLRFGETVLVVGCGGLGLNLILAAKLAQASMIVAMDLHGSKRQTALDMGATYFVSPEGIYGLATFPPFDCIIDTSGSATALRETLPFLAPSGRYIMVGQPKPGQSVTLDNARHFFDGEGKSLRATQGGRFQPARDIPRYVALYKAGLLDVRNLVSHRLPLERINEGIDLVRNGQAGRVMIEIGAILSRACWSAWRATCHGELCDNDFATMEQLEAAGYVTALEEVSNDPLAERQYEYLMTAEGEAEARAYYDLP